MARMPASSVRGRRGSAGAWSTTSRIRSGSASSAASSSRPSPAAGARGPEPLPSRGPPARARAAHGRSRRPCPGAAARATSRSRLWSFWRPRSWAPSSSLRQLAERSPAVAVIACYREEGRDLGRSIRGHLGEAGLEPEPDALAYLDGASRRRPGGDASRDREARALCRPGREAGEAGRRCGRGRRQRSARHGRRHLRLDRGRPGRLERNLDRLLGEGTAPIAIIRASANIVVRLLRLQAEVERGSSPQAAVDGARPPVFFRAKPQYVGALGAWPAARLAGALAVLQEAEIRCKSAGAPEALLCRHALSELADRAGASPRRREPEPVAG